METKKIFEIVGISCAGVGLLLSFIFTFLSCSFSAKNIVKGDYNGSLMFIAVAVGAVIAIAGAVFAFLSMTKGEKMSIMVLITFGLVAATIIFATIPHITLCAYNCSIESAVKSRWN